MSCCNNKSPTCSDQTTYEDECVPFQCPSEFSIIIGDASGFRKEISETKIFQTKNVPNIEHEVNVAKSILQRGSSLTGDNLFDHLSELIKRLLSERPENAIDFFEEFSFNIRQQKYHIPEKFPWVIYKMPDMSKIVHFEGKPSEPPDDVYDICEEEKRRLAKESKITLSQTDMVDKSQRLLLLDENVLRLHLYWALCGLGFQADEVMHLACAIQKIQYQPTIEHARFWGKIYGIQKSYYIVEATISKSEMQLRLEQMKEEMTEMITEFRNNSDIRVKDDKDSELCPGVTWKDSPPEELAKMIPAAAPIPKTKTQIRFDIPPEAIGTGLNRRSYFVVNSLHDEWFELPIVTPKQIKVSRSIKKYLTGDLDAEVYSYPEFPGREKHYLRAMIARITSGTYIAPQGYYRKLTKKERMELLGEEFEEVYLDEEGEEEEEDTNNDAPIVINSSYEPLGEKLLGAAYWAHIRPSILKQGRAVYFDEEEARRALEREARLRQKAEEEATSYDIDEYEDENGEEMIEEADNEIETGAPLFSQCIFDKNDEDVIPWTARVSSIFNAINRLYIMRSNLWPGAYAFSFDKYSDNIYLGWGTKYVARNMKVEHVPPIRNDYTPDGYYETTDPTVEMEEAWKRYISRAEKMIDEFGGEEAEEYEEPC